MLMVISPAKSLDFETPLAVQAHSQPDYLAQSQLLVEQLRTLSPAQLASLMDISDPLAVLNVQRYAEWQLPFALGHARQAVFAFNGDVYEGLDAATLSAADLDFAQQHVRILSGLYGVLRPLDLIRPYRLEMGTRLANARGKDLYAFWGDRLRVAIEAERAAQSGAVLVNLASEEYFKALQPRHLGGVVIQPVFEDWKNGRYKVVSFFAKRARGLMVRYAIEHRVLEPEGLQGFDAEGYAFAPAVSDATTWVFRRCQGDD